MTRRRWPKLLAVVATFTTLLLSHAASAAALPPAGTITIDFSQSALDAVRYQPPTGAAVVEPFAERSTVTGSQRDAGYFAYFNPPSVLDFSGNGSCLPVGFTDQKNWVGCFKKGGIGTGRLVNGQTLSIALNPTGPVAGTIVTDWTVSFTAKQNVVFQLLLDTLAGDDPRTVTVYTGLAGIAAEERGLLPNERVCALAADSSPDSDAGCPVSGTEPWQKMSVTVISDGALSLGDQDSVLHLSKFSGVILCGETTEVITDPATGIAVQIWRLADNYSDEGDEDQTCLRVPYSIEFGGQTLELIVDYLDPPQRPQWEVQVTFDGIDISSLREADDPNTTADERLQPYPTDADDTIDSKLPQAVSQFLPGDQEYYLDACFGNPIFDEFTGRLKDFDPPLDDESNPDWPDQSTGTEAIPGGVPGNQVACWFRQQDDLRNNPDPTSADGSSNLIFKTFWWYVRGDIKLRVL